MDSDIAECAIHLVSGMLGGIRQCIANNGGYINNSKLHCIAAFSFQTGKKTDVHEISFRPVYRVILRSVLFRQSRVSQYFSHARCPVPPVRGADGDVVRVGDQAEEPAEDGQSGATDDGAALRVQRQGRVGARHTGQVPRSHVVIS